MKRGALIMLSLALIWVIANLPAGLIRFFIDEQQLAVVAPQGTLWNGSATLVSNLGLQGRSHWQTSLFQSGTLQPGLALHITHDSSDLRALAQIGFSSTKVTLSGTIAARACGLCWSAMTYFSPVSSSYQKASGTYKVTASN